MVYSWVTPNAKVKDTETKRGRGLFAVRPIRKGEIVMVNGGRIVPAKDLYNNADKKLRDHCFQVTKKFYICPIGEDYLGAYMVNHSCEPNLGGGGTLSLVALRNIKKGEELCYDYATTDSFDGYSYHTMRCYCGTPSCRGRVTDDDWKIKKLQRKYKGYFSPYLERKIKARKR